MRFLSMLYFSKTMPFYLLAGGNNNTTEARQWSITTRTPMRKAKRNQARPYGAAPGFCIAASEWASTWHHDKNTQESDEQFKDLQHAGA